MQIELFLLVIQGTTITAMAKWLGLDDKTDEKQTADSFDMVMPDGFQSQTIEADNTAATLQNHGNRLMDFRMPDSITVLMVKRNDSFFIPNGKTTLQVADRLMIVGDDLEKIRQVINHLQLDECVQKETKMITEVLSEQFEKRRVKKNNIAKPRKNVNNKTKNSE